MDAVDNATSSSETTSMWETTSSVAWNTTPVFNMSIEDYLLLRRGPKHLPMEIVLPITLIYTVIFVSGVVGNVAVCVVIARNAAMHTATNYYLFSLAVSDLALLILGLPNDLGVFWQQYPWILGEAVCKLRALISEMMSYTSVLTIVAFSMERFLAICHPLYSYTMSGLKRAVRIIALIWLVSLLSAAPFAVYTTVDYIDYPPGSGIIIEESAFCAMFDFNIPENWPCYELSFVFFFLIPMAVILVLYVRMGMVIHSRQQNRIGETVEGAVQSRKAIIRMLSTVVIAFFFCWAPFHAQRLFYLYGRASPHFDAINEVTFLVTGCFYYFSSTVNPILYNVMSAKYRDAFRETLCCWRRPRRASFRDHTDSTVLVRGRSVLQSTIRRSKLNGDDMSRDLNGESPLIDMAVIVSANGRSSITKWTKKPTRTTSEELRKLQADLETCI